MTAAKDDDVLKKLPAAAADPAFRDAILPGTATGEDGQEAENVVSNDVGQSEQVLPR